MAFEATIQDRNVLPSRLRGTAKTLLMIGAGVLIGLMLAETTPSEPVSGTFLHTGDIPGEDWHGNVRRSYSPQ
ncbi:hypothetical protein [uncultured Roseobacter sp.]|uniref:hypothetical protein n=1 Tax=uncultured Roseobacter sp. TaxID=114847 RepID=UPI0026145AAD|nr:hypothetical protein [uncultured Roseobacter sp.]